MLPTPAGQRGLQPRPAPPDSRPFTLPQSNRRVYSRFTAALRRIYGCFTLPQSDHQIYSCFAAVLRRIYRLNYSRFTLPQSDQALDLREALSAPPPIHTRLTADSQPIHGRQADLFTDLFTADSLYIVR